MRLFSLFCYMVRALTRFAWKNVLFDVGRVEWKFGRHDDNSPKDWVEWSNIRAHLKESGQLWK